MFHVFYFRGVCRGGISTRKEWFVKQFAVAHQQKDKVSIFFCNEHLQSFLATHMWVEDVFFGNKTCSPVLSWGLQLFHVFSFLLTFLRDFSFVRTKIRQKIAANFWSIPEIRSILHIHFDQQFRSGSSNQLPNGWHYPTIFPFKLRFGSTRSCVFHWGGWTSYHMLKAPMFLGFAKQPLSISGSLLCFVPSSGGGNPSHREKSQHAMFGLIYVGDYPTLPYRDYYDITTEVNSKQTQPGFHVNNGRSW